MLRGLLIVILTASALLAQANGEMTFKLGNQTYSTQLTRAAVQKKGDKVRILIAVKDKKQRFVLILAADVRPGDEKKPLVLTSEDSDVSVTLRTAQGSLAVLPHTQMPRIDPNFHQIERVEVDSGETEDDPATQHTAVRQKRHKIRMQYRQRKPHWHSLSREERLRTGLGVIRNESFKDTFFALQLVPVVANEKVVTYTGTFSGNGRFSRSLQGSEIKPITNGQFQVQVEYAQ
ncbi:MAG: hypothetical protein JSR44_04395 [Spirochaetes bacterium]|nr:hypothetical protein [Spirochaetota bacterium]